MPLVSRSVNSHTARLPSASLAALRPAGSAANGGLGGRLLDIRSTMPRRRRLARDADGSAICMRINRAGHYWRRSGRPLRPLADAAGTEDGLDGGGKRGIESDLATVVSCDAQGTVFQLHRQRDRHRARMLVEQVAQAAQVERR